MTRAAKVIRLRLSAAPVYLLDVVAQHSD